MLLDCKPTKVMYQISILVCSTCTFPLLQNFYDKTVF